MPNWERIAVVGHSFSRRLLDFTRRREENRSEDSSFKLVNAEVRWFFQGGMKAKDVLSRWQDQLADFRPQLVVLMIGDNDIEKGVDVDGLAGLIHAIASVLLSKRVGAHAVMVGQLMPRFAGSYYSYGEANTYNSIAWKVNRALDEALEGAERVFFWSHEFAYFPWEGVKLDEFRSAFILNDGVHLSKNGNSKLYKSIRLALHLKKHLLK